MFQTVLFDLYGTLCDIRTDEWDPALWESMSRFYAARGAVYDPTELRDAYFSAVRTLEGDTLRHDSHEAHPEIKIEEVFALLFTKRGVTPAGGDTLEAGRLFRRESTRYIRLYPGARELLLALRSAGRRVVLLSNAQRIFTVPELEQLGILDLFDAVYISSDYGVKKPDRRFFEICLREQGIDPSTAVMVGNDGVCDIAGARAAGLGTVYIRSNISPAEPLPAAGWVLEEMDLYRVREILLQ